MRPLVLLPLILMLAACQQSPQPAAVATKDESKQAIREYALHGEVLRVDPKDRIAAIKHDAIGDWMGAMTMEFPIKDQKDLEALKPGQKINATVHVQGDTIYWVDQIHEDTGAAK